MPQNVPEAPVSSEVRCIECDVPAGESVAGWKAYIVGGHDDEPLEVTIYCPSCAEREFGEP